MWLSKRQILVWLKHKTSNLTGGTINIAANVVNCNWPVNKSLPIRPHANYLNRINMKT